MEHATVAVVDLDASWQTGFPPELAAHAICQDVGPNDAISVSLAVTIYDAAGRPQGPYLCLVLTNVCYRVFDAWCNVQLEAHAVAMHALRVVDLCSACWSDKNSLVDFANKVH